MIDALASEPRLIVDVRLKPLAGSTFQPTGFPDLGAATFQRPGDQPALLVESVQSMTNRLEDLGWDAPAGEPIETLSRLPYVEVVSANGGDLLTSSRLEPHRLAAAYIRDATIDGSKGTDWIGERLGLRKGHPLDWAAIYRAVFELDPLCLLHGVFFSDQAWHGNPKVRRAVTAVIEALDVSPVVSGGVKRDDVQISVDKETGGRGAEEGYGFVPFGRTEFSAREILLTAVVDLEQIRGYGLAAEEGELLELLALWELGTLVSGPLRLRTACDLDVTEIDVRRPRDFELPDAAQLAERIAESPAKFDHQGARSATWPAPKG
ncbi:MAG: type I-U CRISPR-associated RAMP protein Csb1/Cas7u [Thermoleophilaceae bacterium]